MILNETVAAIADAIREKTGKSELIKPVDFAEEIKGITAGGGESGGGLSYFAIDTSIEGSDVAFTHGSFLTKVIYPDTKIILPTTLLVREINEELIKAIRAIATDVNAKVVNFDGQTCLLWGGMAGTIEDFISMGVLTPITKEEFYSLE